ncbi:hypothetical protein [uncultured Microbacterium sp.]|uniref:hypothetical protein n=1 Tax=uncultured Microbacterium sp. TaxID=191216 RepID=UPI00262D9BD7|nr:hypothetical protein [uncultured Microbacterium sp.]
MAVKKQNVKSYTHPFAQALRRGIEVRGVTLTWVHDAIAAQGAPVSVATLSSWRSGARMPEGERSREAVEALEQALGMPSGALTGLIGPSRRTGRVGEVEFPWGDEQLGAAVEEVLAEFPLERPLRTRELTTQVVADVGPGLGVTQRATRSLLQSTTGVVTAIPILEVMPWASGTAPTFHAVSGGRIAQTAAHSSGRVFGAVVELDQPLTPGDTVMLETRVEFPADGPPVREVGHGAARSIRELLLWVRFTPDALPGWCNLVDDQPGEALDVTPFPLGQGGAANVVRAPWGPGALGIHWGDAPGGHR